ncbi:hypothetical protein [Thiobaca trueperi]|uniref:hypothetical protein n=1 Tax=Thiobaca trueperi TaxID=127458 RepID=UPI00104650DA|nr:hypothetical protein [Thiobaca trueperi]
MTRGSGHALLLAPGGQSGQIRGGCSGRRGSLRSGTRWRTTYGAARRTLGPGCCRGGRRGRLAGWRLDDLYISREIWIWSRHTLALDESSGAFAVLDVRGFPLVRQWHAIYPQGRHLTSATRAFLERMHAEKAAQARDGATTCAGKPGSAPA